ncbi:MAG: nicotinate-nucleotide adenylyltransferase [Clostridia bacterium]
MGARGRAIGLMGGTFNPIHYGHLVAAETARDAFALDRVIFVPAGEPPHKARTVAPAEHRYLMTFLATASNRRFDTSRVEIERPGPSYTSDTLAHFHALDPDAHWYFITGADAVMEIAGWHAAEDIFRYAEVIAVSRPGYPLRLRTLEPALGDKVSRVHHLEVPALAISSSDVRARLSKGLSIRYLVPEAVEDYIRKCGLYESERQA